MFTVAVLTISDKGSRGEREDITGPNLQHFLKENGYNTVYYKVIPDETEIISTELILIADNIGPNLILTNGGTGFSARDNTPEATLSVIEKQIPGFCELMRMKSFEISSNAVLSRAVSGIRKKSIIVNLPGSPKGALENLKFITKPLSHGIEILTGKSSECATTDKK